VAWLPPELDEGAEPWLKPPELELPVLELPVLELPVLVPELPELEPELVPVEPELVLAAWVDPGSPKETAPATATPARPTVVVMERTRARPRSLAAMAWRMPSPRSLPTFPSLCCATQGSLHGSSRLALKIECLVHPPARRG
jgi:hypothetical protein